MGEAPQFVQALDSRAAREIAGRHARGRIGEREDGRADAAAEIPANARRNQNGDGAGNGPTRGDTPQNIDAERGAVRQFNGAEDCTISGVDQRLLDDLTRAGASQVDLGVQIKAKR